MHYVHMIRLLAAIALLGLVPASAQAADVLLIWDAQTSHTASLIAALEAGGHTVTESDTDESGYLGHNPPPT